jgi:beta-galactosidase
MSLIDAPYNFYVTSFVATMGLSLRRTLVAIRTLLNTTKTRHKDAKLHHAFVFLCAFASLWFNPLSAQSLRSDISLDKGWRSIADDNSKQAYDGFEQPTFSDKKWKQVEVPHNWDACEGYRRMRHGNRHGYAWYRKSFTVKQQPNKRYFLYFEGVGSYATVWLNGKQVGYHAGGRTTFTIDVTNTIKFNGNNLLAVRADHPANIKDLPWVCGGCSDERGFSEGSQPMGIFRPVHLIITDPVRIEPFGVHIWNNADISTTAAQLYVETEVKNYTAKPVDITIIHKIIDSKGTMVAETKSASSIKAGTASIIKQQPPVINQLHLWSLEDPYLYKVVSEVIQNGQVVDRITTPYGIRWISWPIGKAASANQFLLNGKPVFINGIAEYEHLIGNSHAFSEAQIKSRVMQMKAAGFNAFRDAHHPHNLRYQNYWDSLGLLCWTQMGAHVWYDTPEFRKNFKELLKEWVKERRNSPSIVLWGLQNESKLPEDFAKECTALIRELDPTTSSQRLVTTCNGGSGTDWDVPQNWTGTYGGNPATYDNDVKRQVLIGEYGAWRTLDLHTEGGFVQNGSYSEDRMTQLMEMKVQLAEQAKDSTAGHFMWLLTSHDNPGRVQGGEGYRELDRIGPVNYKGLLTPWEEPLDVYYMYRSNYAPKDKEPMVYIVSHTWPNRWTTTGKKDGIVVYSNCDEVELFNDVRSQSLGRRKKGGKGTHFQWDGVQINYNVLYAIGYVNGKEIAKDYIVLNSLPKSPRFNEFNKDAKQLLKPKAGYHYLYRVNCGGPQYTDEHKNTWLADREKENDATWGSSSWTKDFAGMPPYFASQRSISDPIAGTNEWRLFQTFRYGREKLEYNFPVEDGEYLIELYFTEPWWGRANINATGFRLFDVAINNKTVISGLDIYKEAGLNAALKKTVLVKVTGGQLRINFPKVASGQAVISAIAIGSKNKHSFAASPPKPLLNILNDSTSKNWIQDWLSTGDASYDNEMNRFQNLPPELFGAQWIRDVSDRKRTEPFIVNKEADVFIAIDSSVQNKEWFKGFSEQPNLVLLSDGTALRVHKKRMQKDERFNTAIPAQGFVMAQPASNIEPAYDLKAVTSYKAVNGKLVGAGIVKGQIDGKDRVIFTKDSDDSFVEIDIAVGVADTYSLTMSYNNPSTKNIDGRLQFMAADGTMMREEAVTFTPTRAGKSNYINSTTGSMINAGHYKLRIRASSAEGLSINALDVQ